MIRVTRPADAPAHLASHGVPDLNQIVALFDANPRLYSVGLKPVTLPFDTNIYGHASVKGVLQQAQHHKCCYCEGIFHGFAAGDVEHFRPKAYWQQSSRSTRGYPGYYWLAYEWTNLLFSCQVCNRSHKRNIFPLANQDRRARRRTDPIGRERPLLIDPSGPADPRDHIRFHQEVPKGITARGRTTIEVLKLDRPALNDLRREKLAELIGLRDAVRLLGNRRDRESVRIVRGARAKLKRARQPDAIFSGMARDFFLGT